MTNVRDYLADSHHWQGLSARYPEFGTELPRLVDALDKCFQRDVVLDDQQIGVYGLGKLSVEDFVEVLFLCEHGFVYGGLKLLRGMYERNVTGAYIAEYPEQARLFHDYWFIQLKRLQERAKQVYPTLPGPGGELVAKVASIKDQYDTSECPRCHMRRQLGWSKLSLDSMAVKVSKIWKKRHKYKRSSPNQLQRAYLYYADIANVHIHASMYGVRQHLCIDAQGNIESSQHNEAHEGNVVSSAHAMALVTLDTQNYFFKLGLDGLISELNDRYQEIWLSGPEPFVSS